MPPKRRQKKDAHAKQLQTAQDHTKAEEELSHGRHQGIVFRTAHEFEARADVVEGGGDGAHCGLEGEAQG